jgi:hypothetical protein
LQSVFLLETWKFLENSISPRIVELAVDQLSVLVLVKCFCISPTRGQLHSTRRAGRKQRIELFVSQIFTIQSINACRTDSMATFNMQEFNEILEKSKDQSQQQKQDQVCRIIPKIFRYQFCDFAILMIHADDWFLF